ncbi:MAG: hypothetical protein D6815_05465, partial [Candidatus Dadabacteria bacterium]
MLRTSGGGSLEPRPERSLVNVPKDRDSHFFKRWVAALVALAGLYGLTGLTWGLPNGNHTWAADSVRPMTPYAVAYHVFFEGFNSGYFYFKYPVGHQLLLAAIGAPVLGWALLTGNLHELATDYPFGMHDPEPVLFALALVMRLVSVVMSIGCLLALMAVARRTVGSRAAIGTGFALLGCYPFVFYQHTTNVEIPFLFWALLGLYATVRAVEEHAPRWYLLLGASAALAVSTKEQIAGFFILLPLWILAAEWPRRSQWHWRVLPRGTAAGAGVAAVTYLVANAAFFNPTGFARRLLFLTHRLDPAVRARYAPYEFPVDVAAAWSARAELAHLREAVEVVAASLGWPALVAAAAGLCLLVALHRRAAAYILVPAAGYYLTSVRILKQVEIRYLLPISVLLAVPTGLLLARMWSHRILKPLAAGLVAFGLVYSADVLGMLVGDARYACEHWMEPRLAAGRTVEVYQSWTYLPRWQGHPGVRKPPLEEVTIAGLKQRRPDYVVLSSKGLEGITMYPNPDWRDGRGMMLVSR